MAFSSAVNSAAIRSEMAFEKPTLDCSGKLAYGLTKEDCYYMSSIGMTAQGLSAQSQSQSDDAYIWVGDQGPNTFTFTNAGNSPMTLII
ncbi:hypothetical protein J3459_017827 [Metarhizium acridum]|nr:hypothetical protein J3459_017827 [Metarhizium acridum]